MYFCNAQLIISPWKLRNINLQFIIIIIITKGSLPSFMAIIIQENVGFCRFLNVGFWQMCFTSSALPRDDAIDANVSLLNKILS